MNNHDFLFLQKFLHDKSGLAIREDKVYLLESRLTPLMREHNIPDITSMVNVLRTGSNSQVVDQVIDAMTTNETLFFRDDKPFAHFRQQLLPGMLDARKDRRSLRIWSAACSTGQEPYSIAISLSEALPDIESWNIEIFATDISPSALELAKKGMYTQFEIQRGMPIQMLMKYFEQNGTNWAVKDNIKKMVRFQNFNLLEPMSQFGMFDIVFCRNVLIYFDEDTKKTVLENMSRRMVSDAYLFLGGSEAVLGLCPSIVANNGCSGLYTLKGNSSAVGMPATANAI